MKVLMTEYLQIDLETENWECRVCGHVIGSANEAYKEGLLVHNRDPREIHPPIIDPEKYRFTFSPDPEWVRILEYCCPGCGTQVETEYAVPGHPPLHDMQPDLPALKAQWARRGELMKPWLVRQWPWSRATSTDAQPVTVSAPSRQEEPDRLGKPQHRRGHRPTAGVALAGIHTH